MPQASNDLREKMKEYFDDEVDDVGPKDYLIMQGYKLLPNWRWHKPTPMHKISEKEYRCLQFLVDEWDYGGIES